MNCPLGRIHQPTLLASRFTSSDVKSCVKALQTDVARTVVNSFVISSIDYCNCLMAGAPQYQLNRLQAVMNSAGRLICGLNMFDRISRVLHDRLHWLPVPQRIQYKLCLLVYKAFRGIIVFTLSCTTVSSRLLSTCQLSSRRSCRNYFRTPPPRAMRRCCRAAVEFLSLSDCRYSLNPLSQTRID